jgi:hypothetical protein
MALIITAAGQAPGSWAATSSYQVYAFNDLGMHCIDPDFSVFAILPPYNVVHAQVVRKRTPPKFFNDAQLSSLQLRLIYSPMADPTGSINTTSIGKTNFWRYVSKLFGVSLPPDVGLSGAKMPNASFGPQPLNSFDPAMRWFTAAGIPLEGLDDNLKFNYYPLNEYSAG